MRFSINKELFEDILLKKVIILEKKDTNFWKNELLEPFFENSKLILKTRNFDKLILVNGFGRNKPQLTIECLKLDYCVEKGLFTFYLGKIFEQKNIKVQNKLIEQLIKEETQTKAQVKMFQAEIDFK